MGAKSKRKGSRVERELVRILQDWGLAAERMPLSGALGGKYSGDVSVPLLGVERKVEIKCRADGFAQLYGWLGKNDFLVVKADRKEPLVVLPLRLAEVIAKAAERARDLP